MNVNSVTMLGTIAREPQADFLPSGAQEVKTQIKLVERRDGKEYATYCPISAFGRAGENLLNTAQGGTIAITGKVAWKKATKEGEKGNLYVMVRTLEIEECPRPQAEQHDGVPAHGDAGLPF